MQDVFQWDTFYAFKRNLKEIKKICLSNDNKIIIKDNDYQIIIKLKWNYIVM